jgi:hypothetical protein
MCKTPFPDLSPMKLSVFEIVDHPKRTFFLQTPSKGGEQKTTSEPQNLRGNRTPLLNRPILGGARSSWRFLFPCFPDFSLRNDPSLTPKTPLSPSSIFREKTGKPGPDTTKPERQDLFAAAAFLEKISYLVSLANQLLLFTIQWVLRFEHGGQSWGCILVFAGGIVVGPTGVPGIGGGRL